LGQSTLVVLCAGSTLLLVQSYAPDKAPYINCLEPSPSQVASTFGSWFFLLLVRLNLGFILRETCCCAHHTFLLGFPTGCLPCTFKHFSGGRGERGFLQGVKAWECPEAPLLHRQIAGHLSRHYIFIASYTMLFSWSVFIFAFSFLLFCLLQ
jgi:hypothetical protein